MLFCFFVLADISSRYWFFFCYVVLTIFPHSFHRYQKWFCIPLCHLHHSRKQPFTGGRRCCVVTLPYIFPLSPVVFFFFLIKIQLKVFSTKNITFWSRSLFLSKVEKCEYDKSYPKWKIKMYSVWNYRAECLFCIENIVSSYIVYLICITMMIYLLFIYGLVFL